MIYTNYKVQKNIPSGKYTFKDLEALLALCVKSHEFCVEKMITDVQNGKHYINEFKDVTPEAIVNHIKKYFLLTIEVFGSHGEYYNTSDPKKLSVSELPIVIEKIIIGNSFYYNHFIKNFPSIYFDIKIDFKDVKILDLKSSPTNSTADGSSLMVASEDLITAPGLNEQFINFFNKHKNYHYFFHAENIYDIMLWFICLPILLIYFFKIEEQIGKFVQNVPVILQFIIGTILIINFLYIFRIIFNVSRWFFPVHEISDQINSIRKVAKYIYSAATATIIGTVFYDLLSWMISKILS